MNDGKVLKIKLGGIGELAQLNNAAWLNSNCSITIKESFQTYSGMIFKTVEGVLMNWIGKIPIWWSCIIQRRKI